MRTFHLSSRTEYLMNGKKSKAVDLKAGETVSIAADSKSVAKIVEVKQ